MSKELNIKERKRSLTKLLAGLFCFAGCVFLCLSFISFNYLDPSINRATDSLVHNLAGSYGAIAADLFYQVFGLASMLVPFTLFIWSIILLKSLSIRLFLLRILVLLVSITFLAAILASFEESENWMYTTYGGVVGYRLSSDLMRYLKEDYIYFATVISIFSLLFASALDGE